MKRTRYRGFPSHLSADEKINAKRYGIEEQVMILIATQQPMAHDLRLLASILEVSAELERMGDYAKGIATINVRMGEEAVAETADRHPPHGPEGLGHAPPGLDRLYQ